MTQDETRVDVHYERGMLSVALECVATGETIFHFTGDEATSRIGPGMLDPLDWRCSAYWYAVGQGLISSAERGNDLDDEP